MSNPPSSASQGSAFTGNNNILPTDSDHQSNLKDIHDNLNPSDEATSSLQSHYAPPSSLARPKRTVKPTRRLLESIAGRTPTKKNPTKSHQANLVSSMVDPPATMTEALSRSDSFQWQIAIQAEFDSLHKNQTWRLTTLPANRKPITSKWIFKIKTKADGTLDKYKARLVARGFT